jgi:hypothetical protein
MNSLTVIDCIKQYGTPRQQRHVRDVSSYPYPGAKGTELATSLKNAALACDEVAVKVLLDQFVNGSLGYASGFPLLRISCIQKIERKVEKQNTSQEGLENILQSLKNASQQLQAQPVQKRNFFWPVLSIVPV